MRTTRSIPFRSPARAAALGLLALLLAACGSPDTPAGPETPPPVVPPPPPPPPPVVDTPIVLNRAPIPASGGTLRVDRPGSPLHGLTIELPAGAYPTTTQWTVTERPSRRPPLPEGLSQTGILFTIGNEQAYAARAFMVRIPVPAADRDNTVAFMHDPATGTFELLPLLGTDTSGIVVASRHVSADRLLQATGTAARAGLRAGSTATGARQTTVSAFGEIDILLVTADPALLAGSAMSSFQPGVHDWEFPNYGSWLEPLGFCSGATTLVLYHHYTRGGAPLFGTYVRPGAEWFENTQGIRMASMVQYRTNWLAFDQQVEELFERAESSGLGRPRTQALALTAAIQLTGLPQYLSIFQAGFTAGHAIVAYGTSAGTFHVADPGYPGVGQTIEYDGVNWVPFQFSTRTDIEPSSYVQAFPHGVSALISHAEFDTQWAAFEAGTAGDGTFPRYRLEFLEDLTDTLWLPLQDSVVTASEEIRVRGLCETCTAGNTFPADYIRLRGYAEDGWVTEINDPSAYREGVPVIMDVGREVFGFRVDALSPPVEGRRIVSLVDFQRIPIRRVEFTLSVTPDFAALEEPVSFTVEHGGLFHTGRRLRFDFGDGSPVVIESSRPSTDHVYDSSGTFLVRVELLDANDRVRGRDTATVVITERELTVTPKDARVEPDTLITFTATTDLPLPPAPSWEWDLGDGRTRTTTVNTLEITYPPDRDEEVTYTVMVRLKTADKVWAAGRTDVTVVPGAAPHWRITSIQDQDELFDELEGSDPIVSLFKRLLAVPTAGLISIAPVVDDSTELRLRVLRAAVWDPAACCPPPSAPAAEWQQLLGVTPTVTYSFGPFFSGWGSSTWSQSTTDLDAGTVTGQFIPGTASYRIKDAGTQVGPAGAIRINATRSGTTMTGQITITIWWNNENTGEVERPGETSRFPFTAVRMR